MQTFRLWKIQKMKINCFSFFHFLLFQLLPSIITISLSTYSQCRSNKIKLEQGLGYNFRWGFLDSLHFRTPQELATQITSNSSYDCPPSTVSLLNHQYFYQNKEIFDGKRFLSLLKGKTLGIIGDSLGQQLFMGLDVELLPLVNEKKSTNGNGTHFDKLELYPDHLSAAIRVYDETNTTILFCKDNTISFFSKESFEQDPVHAFCRSRLLSSSDYLLISIGAHYKPESSSSDPSSSYSSYQQHLLAQTQEFETNLLQFRLYLKNLQHEKKIRWIKENHHNEQQQQQSLTSSSSSSSSTSSQTSASSSLPSLPPLPPPPPPQVVLWRLLSHVGPIDEYNSFSPLLRDQFLKSRLSSSSSSSSSSTSSSKSISSSSSSSPSHPFSHNLPYLWDLPIRFERMKKQTKSNHHQHQYHHHSHQILNNKKKPLSHSSLNSPSILSTSSSSLTPDEILKLELIQSVNSEPKTPYDSSSLSSSSSSLSSSFSHSHAYHRVESESDWVKQFNIILRSLSDVFHDRLLDYSSLSHQLIRHERERMLELSMLRERYQVLQCETTTTTTTTTSSSTNRRRTTSTSSSSSSPSDSSSHRKLSLKHNPNNFHNPYSLYPSFEDFQQSSLSSHYHHQHNETKQINPKRIQLPSSSSSSSSSSTSRSWTDGDVCSSFLSHPYIIDKSSSLTTLYFHSQMDVLQFSWDKPVENLPIHADSLHYCSGGLFRAGNLMLMKEIEWFEECGSVVYNHHHHS